MPSAFYLYDFLQASSAIASAVHNVVGFNGRQAPSMPSGATVLWRQVARQAGAALDETVLGMMNRPSRYPTPEGYERLRREIEDTRDLYASKGRLASPADFNLAPPPLVEPEIHPVGVSPFLYEQMTFESGYAPDPDDRVGVRWLEHQRNRTAHAWALRYEDPTRPWLICLHGLGTGSPYLDFPGFRATYLHNRLGLNMLFPVLPLHGPRREHGMDRGALLSYELVESLHGTAQAVWDVRRMISWIRANGGRRIGLYGQSFGAYTASLIAGLEDIDLVIAGVPLADVPDLFARHTPAEAYGRDKPDGVLGSSLRELFSAVSPLAVTPNVARERRFVFAGVEDRMSTAGQARRLWEHWEQPPIQWFDGGHIGFFLSRRVDSFIRRALYSSGFAVHVA